MRNRRSTNVDLLRHLNGGHKPTAKKLRFVANENYVSKMATGVMDVSDDMARRIEDTLGLPKGWLDRDNEKLLNMNDIDFLIVTALSSYPVERKEGLLSFLSE